MNITEAARGPNLVPPTGANEMDLHELITQIERDPIMRIHGYVMKANGWVDPSTLACHRYVVLTIEHRSESGAAVGTYFIRIDRRAERHISALKFIRGLGKAKSSDRVVLSYDQDRLLAPSKTKQVESALRLDQPLRLDRLGLMLDVIRVEFADYKLTKENCWAMTSVILQLLEAEGRGAYLHGKLCFPEWAPEVRGRVQDRFMTALPAVRHPSHPEPTPKSQAPETSDLPSRIMNHAILEASHPPAPLHLVGRDDYLQRIIELMKSKASLGASARLVIGGPGGIGKTSIALAIFHSSELDGTFPPTRRFFVPCQFVTTASTFLSVIASSLGVTISRGDALALVMERLKAEGDPLMLVLDNAESFWFDYEIQPRARTILRHICSVTTVTLLLTIRGTERPNITIWDPLPLLGPLSLLHARQAFLAIATDCEPSASLDRLLKMVDYVPLAVSLLARRSQITGEIAAMLCDRWEKEHTGMLKLGGREPDDNIDVSIKLSLDSPLMQSDHNARRLLSVVSYLPAGVSEEAYSSMSLSDEGSSAAEFLLRRLSLTYSPTPGWVTTLEPIRAYMRRHHSPLAEDMEAVEDWHVNLANTNGNYKPGDIEFPNTSTKLAVNSANMTFILRACIQQRTGLAAIASAVLAFSHFLYWTRPNGDLLEVLIAAGINELNDSTKGRCLQCLGDILQARSQYEEAQSKLEEAHSYFIGTSDGLRASQCLQSLGETLRMRCQYEEARLKLEEARSKFVFIGNRRGAAQCLRSLANILKMRDQYEEARSKLEEARSEFIIIGDRLGAADCLQGLGDILRMLGQYEGAQLKLEEAQSEFVLIGDRLGATQCLQSLGNILIELQRYDKARLKLEEARSEFIIIGDKPGAAQCLRSLGNILMVRLRLEEAQSVLEEARSEFILIGDRLGPAQCLQNLGNISLGRKRYDDAQLKLEEAQSEFIVIGNHLGAAQCSFSLGTILWMQSHFEEAKSKIKGAGFEFTRLGMEQEADLCQRSLDDITREQGQQ